MTPVQRPPVQMLQGSGPTRAAQTKDGPTVGIVATSTADRCGQVPGWPGPDDARQSTPPKQNKDRINLNIQDAGRNKNLCSGGTDDS